METTELIKIASIIISLMIAIIGHEIMHGFVAYRYGDFTAKNAGRLSPNPIVHIDPIGTILVPALLFFSGAPFLFGWAKPVPIDTRTVFKNGGYNGTIAVSLAGIAYNFSLAILFSFMLSFLGKIDSIMEYFLAYSVIYNVVLGIFNLYPIPPLDGSHALNYFCQKYGFKSIPRFLNSISRYGMIILILLIATPLSKYFFAPIKYIVKILLPH